MKTNNETETAQSGSSAHSALGPVLDFGGALVPSQCACGFGRRETNQVSRSFDHTPKAPHDPFKQKPPSYPSLF